jgi:hypothetical protein
MSPFEYEYAKRDANVCGSGMNAEKQMTCRGRPSILGLLELPAQANGNLPQRKPGITGEHGVS